MDFSSNFVLKKTQVCPLEHDRDDFSTLGRSAYPNQKQVHTTLKCIKISFFVQIMVDYWKIIDLGHIVTKYVLKIQLEIYLFGTSSQMGQLSWIFLKEPSCVFRKVKAIQIVNFLEMKF